MRDVGEADVAGLGEQDGADLDRLGAELDDAYRQAAARLIPPSPWMIELDADDPFAERPM
jgi:hypothetical protein